MSRKLFDTLGLLVFFAALFALSGGRNSAAPRYRDAPADFADISVEDIRSQKVAMPEPVPAAAASGRSAGLQRVAIYGDNTLADYYRVSKPLRELADSVVAFVDKSSLGFDEETRTYSPLKLATVGETITFPGGVGLLQ